MLGYYKGVLYALCVSTFVTLGLGAFDINSKNNVAVYYGQGYNQKPLNVYCREPTIDVIILSFVHLFPAQANGYPGLDLGNQCTGDTYPGPGWAGVNDPSKNALHKCPNIQRDLAYCRKVSPDKKFLLSLGGGTNDYQLAGASNGVKFAQQLFYIFGPRQQNLVNSGIPRPFDYNNVGFSVDGFDMDIEHLSTDNATGYKALVKELKRLFGTVNQKMYLSASPACYVPDPNNQDMLSTVAFDLLFIQFYGSYECSAARWAKENPAYKVGGPFAYAGFTFDKWTDYVATTPSKNARLLIGLPGSTAAADPGFAIPVSSASNLANAYYCRPNFGGYSIWQATAADASVSQGKTYYQNLKAALQTASMNTSRCATDGTAKFPVSNNARCGVSGSTNFGTTCPSSQCCNTPVSVNETRAMGGANFAWINSSHDELQYDAEKKRAVRVQAMKAAAASRKKTGTWGKQNMRQANVVRYTSQTNEGGPQRAQLPEEDDDETPHMRQSQQQRQKQKHQTSTVRARDAWRSKSHVVPVIRFLKSSSSSSLSTNDTSHPLYDGTHAAPPALISRIQQCYYSRPARPLPLGDFERVSADLGLNVLDLDELTAVAAGQAAGSLLARNRASLHTLVVQRRQRSYLFHVPARYGHGSCLDDALRCVAIKARRVLVAGATGGAGVGVDSPGGDSYGFYGKALRGLQAAVDKQSNWTDPDILGAIEILSIYELLESPTQPRNWESHIAGATRLIIARGPSRYETEYEKALLASMVSPIILESLRKQEPCFLDEEPWQKVLWSMVRKDTSYFAPRGEGYMRMWMMGARGPRLMPDMYRMAADPASAVEHEIDDLEARCRALRDDLLQWRRDTAEHEEREKKQRGAAGPENGDNNGRERIRSSSLASSGSGSSSRNGGTDTEYLRKEVIGASLAMLVIVCRLIGAVSPLDRAALEAEAVAYAREMRALLAGAAENKCTSFYLEQKIIAADSVLATTDIWLEGVPRVDQVLLDAQQQVPRIIENWKVLAWTQYLPID